MIYNICQSTDFVISDSALLPCLLTSTSKLWSTLHKRALLPVEHLAAMGVPVYAHNRQGTHRFGVEVMQQEGRMSNCQLRSLSGNSMSSIACQCVLAFGLGSLHVHTYDD